MHYICRHFTIAELLPPPQFMPPVMRARFESDPTFLFRCFPWRMLVTMDRMRERYGSMTVNNWSTWPGEPNRARRFSCWRPFDCPEGADLSEHKFFRAFDSVFSKATPAEVWADILANPNHPAFEYLERIEAFEGMTWFHGDFGQHARNGQAIKVIAINGNRAGLPEFINRVAKAA